jgi:hypothetical protein
MVFEFLNCSNDLRTQKISFSRLIPSAISLILLAYLPILVQVTAGTLLF